MDNIVIFGLDDIKDKITLNLYPRGQVQNISPFGKEGLSYVKLSTLKDKMVNEIHNLVCKDCNEDCSSCKFEQAMVLLKNYEFNEE